MIDYEYWGWVFVGAATACFMIDIGESKARRIARQEARYKVEDHERWFDHRPPEVDDE